MDHSQYFSQSSIQGANLRLHYLSQLLREQTGSIVQYGILRGFPIGFSHWAEVAVGGYLLGTYEIAVCAILEALGSPDKVLVDLGAADGIFGIGLVRTCCRTFRGSSPAHRSGIRRGVRSMHGRRTRSSSR